jgi:uncharacterized membrane-anchored protein YhcB (DUF1043 family)
MRPRFPGELVMIGGVRAVKDAFGIESTWGFVMLIALLFGIVGGFVGYVVDAGTKAAERRQQSADRTNLETAKQQLGAAEKRTSELQRKAEDLTRDMETLTRENDRLKRLPCVK